MIASSRKNGTFLMEALWTNFLPSIQKVKELIKDKVVGDPVSIGADFGFFKEFDNNHRFFIPSLAAVRFWKSASIPFFYPSCFSGFPTK